MKPRIDESELVAEYKALTPASAAHAERARAAIPGGTSRDSLVRYPYPPYIVSGRDEWVRDIDGRDYLDYCMNLGPILLGHGFEPIADAIREQIPKGCGFGAPPYLEAQLAEKISRLYPAAERVRFLSTGTEAILYLVRLAKAHTGRSRIIKFIGAYHGSHDSVQVSIRPSGADGIGPAWVGIPQSEGLSPSVGQETLAIPYNDLDALSECLETYKGQIAGVLVDPAMNACGLPAPRQGFLNGIGDLIHQEDGLLLFDEVVTGFRYGLGGAAALYGVQPDLVAFGKVLGGGMPIGAVAGRADVMALMGTDPRGSSRVGQSGTFAGNPLTLVSALAFLSYVEEHPEGYEETATRTECIRSALRGIAAKQSLPLAITGIGSMFQVHAGLKEICDYADFSLRDTDFRRRLFLFMAIHGCLVPAPTGTFFLSWVHTDIDADHFIQLFREFLVDHYGVQLDAPKGAASE